MFDPYDFELRRTSRGVPCYLRRLPYTNRVRVDVVINVGGRQGMPGISHFLEHLLRQRTERFKDDTAMDVYLEGFGGKVINLYTNPDITRAMVEVPTSGLEAAFTVQNQMIESPLFTDEIIEKERKVILNERAAKLRRKDGLKILEEVAAHFYGRQGFIRQLGPIGTLGDFADIEAISKKDLEEHHARYYHSKNLAVFVVGNFSPEEVMDHCERAFSRPQGPFFHMDPPRRYEETEFLPLRKEGEWPDTYLEGHASSQSEVEVLMYTREQFSYGLVPLVRTMLRERLWDETRGKSGNTYSPNVNFLLGRDSTKFGVAVRTTGRIAEVHEGLRNAFASIQGDLSFFERCRAKQKNEALLFEEAVRSIIDEGTGDYRVFGRPISLREWLDGLDRLSIDDVRRFMAIVERNSTCLTTIATG